jgi:hypothetical protein
MPRSPFALGLFEFAVFIFDVLVAVDEYYLFRACSAEPCHLFSSLKGLDTEN